MRTPSGRCGSSSASDGTAVLAHCRRDSACPGGDAAHGCQACTAVVARQPIFDASLSVRGYELLYRSVGATAACFESAVAATAQVVLSAALDVGLRHLIGNLPAFVNFPRELLVCPVPSPIEPRRMVIEVLEDVHADPMLLGALAALRHRGYRIALDDFELHENSEALLGQADMVKLDVQAHSRDGLAGLVAQLRRRQVELIAEKIETREQLERCQALGFEGYQGYFLQRPETFSARRAPTSRLATIKLLLQLHDPTVSVADIEATIACDGGICYRLLRCINSSYYHWPRAIESIQQAIVMLGFDQLRAICSAILLAGFDDRPPYLATQALARARMCEALCVSAGLQDRESYFMVGMLSLLDVLLGLSLQDVLLRLPLSAPIRAALLGGEGALGEALLCVQRYEEGDWAQVRFRALPRNVIAQAYREAVRWADDLWNVIAKPR